MKRMIAGAVLVFALLFGTAATGTAQVVQPPPAPVTQSIEAEKPPTWNQPAMFFSRKVTNSSLSNVNLAVYVNKSCRGNSYSVRPGTTTNSKYHSLFVPAGYFAYWGGLPVFGGLFGRCHNISSTIPMPRLIVQITRPW